MKNLQTMINKVGVCLVIVGMLAFSEQAKAVGISGEISFAGSYTVDNPNLAAATKFDTFSNVTVAALPTGDYAGTAGNAVTMTAFTFDPFGSAVTPLWTFTASGTTYEFDLHSVGIAFESSTLLALSGLGIAHITGKDDTAGTWNLTANTLGTTFSFSSTTAAPVPDGGATAALLGVGLLVVGLVAPRLNQLKARA